jgi:uncharacterized protein YegP (UPF0339 family)
VASASDIAQVYKDTAGQYRFRVLARNGEIIAEGESYSNKSDAIDVLEQHFSNASIVDLTEVEADE